MTEVLRAKNESFDLAVTVKEAEKMNDKSYHLIAPNGMLAGALTKYNGEWGFASVKETSSDEIRLYISEEIVESFLEEVDVVEPESDGE